MYFLSAKDHEAIGRLIASKCNIHLAIYYPMHHILLSLLTCNTCATNGVVMAPILAAAEQKPIAVALTFVGKTSGVYTYTAMNTPDAKARIRNRNTVMTSLQEETRQGFESH